MPWPADVRALADAVELDSAAPIAIGRVGNTIECVRLRDGGRGVLKRGGGALGGADARADVLAEAERLAWLDGRAGAPRLLWADNVGEHAASLATHLPGLPAHELQENPTYAITVAARALRAVHELPVKQCPFGAPFDADDIVIHGDYALPNVIIDGTQGSIVDWSLLRIGDRNEDIDDAERSVGRNFGEGWVAKFREAYDGVA
ncbi:MAG: phosphotransferase [Phycisphaerales bacterium]|nr:phosphotransferase [Phycisphaerales bacterium]